MVLFSQYMCELEVPMPTYSRTKGITTTRVKIFKLFPVSWRFCSV